MSSLIYTLVSKQGDNNIYSIDQNMEKGQSLTFTIENTNGEALEFLPSTAAASAVDYHFALCFQAGFLKNTDLDINLPDNWDMKYASNPKDQSDCYYFLWKGTRNFILTHEAESSLVFEIDKITVKENMITQHIHTLLRINNGWQVRYFEPLPAQKSLQHLLTVREELPYKLDTIGIASRTFEESLGDIDIDDPKDFMTPEEIAEFTKETVNQKFSTLIEKTADTFTKVETKLITEIGSRVGKALTTTEGEIKIVRDKAIPPMEATIISGWNFLQSQTESEISLRITPNNDFTSVHQLSSRGEIMVAQEGAEIAFESSYFNITSIEDIRHTGLDKPTDAGNYWDDNYRNGIATITALPLQPDETGTGSREFTLRRPLELKLVLESKPGTHLNMDTLVLIFSNFGMRPHADTSKISAIEAFDFHIPLYAGPLSIEDAVADNELVLDVGNADKAANLHVYGNVAIGPNSSHRTLDVQTLKAEKTDLTFSVHEGSVGIGTVPRDSRLSISNSFPRDPNLEIPDGKGYNKSPKTLLQLEAKVDDLHNVGNGFGASIAFGAERGGNNPSTRIGGYLDYFIRSGVKTTGDRWGFKFRLRDDEKWNDVMMLHSNGNVGIGQTKPDYKLDVSGDIRFTGQLRGNGSSLTDLTASQIPNLNASKINAGILATDRVPNLNANKINTGTLSVSRIPNLNASKINTGHLAAAQIIGNNDIFGLGEKLKIVMGSIPLRFTEPESGGGWKFNIIGGVSVAIWNDNLQFGGLNLSGDVYTMSNPFVQIYPDGFDLTTKPIITANLRIDWSTNQLWQSDTSIRSHYYTSRPDHLFLQIRGSFSTRGLPEQAKNNIANNFIDFIIIGKSA